MGENEEPDEGVGSEARPVREAREAVCSLSSAEKKAMLSAASYWAGRFDIGRRLGEPSDLLQEALVRILSGARKWPRDVSFPKFVSNTMQSIAGHMKSKELRRDEVGAESVVLHRVPEPMAESRAEAAEELAFLERSLDGDPALLRVLELRAADWQPREIRDELGLSVKEWEAIGARARKKLPGLREKGE